MKSYSQRRAIGIALVVLTISLLLFFIRRDRESDRQGVESAARAPDSRVEQGEPARSAAREMISVAGSNRAEATAEGGVRTISPSGGRDLLEALLERLRAIALAHGFHDEAWPIVESIAALPASEGSPVDARLAAVARGAENDVDRVRAGSMIALALGRSAGAETVAGEFLLGASPELERAGWIGIGLLASSSTAFRIELEHFTGPAGLTTFPATVVAESATPIVEHAILRLQQPLAPELLEIHADRDGNLPRLEEQFTRSIVALAILGPSAGHVGPVRDTLLRWLRGVSPLAWLADDAVLHCLALAARSDEDLAAELLDIAASRLFETEGTAILEALVRLGGREGLVLDHLRGFFASESAIEDDPAFELTRVQAVAALMPLLGVEDPLVRGEASQLVMERLTDPDLDPIGRLLFLTTLTSERSDLVLEAVEALVPEGTSDELIGDVVSFLDAVPAGQRQASQDLLVALLGREGLGSTARLAILREISQLQADGYRDLLVSLRSIETDRAAMALLDEINSRSGR